MGVIMENKQEVLKIVKKELKKKALEIVKKELKKEFDEMSARLHITIIGQSYKE